MTYLTAALATLRVEGREGTVPGPSRLLLDQVLRTMAERAPGAAEATPDGGDDAPAPIR